MAGVLRALAGVVVLLAPGVALVWAFFPGLDWAKRTVLAVVLAFTVVPAILLALHLAVGAAVTTGGTVAVAAAVTVAAGAWRLAAPRLARKV